MKVSVNKLENVVGDMQLIEEKMTEFCTFSGSLIELPRLSLRNTPGSTTLATLPVAD